MRKTLVDFHCSETEDIISDKYLLHLSNPIESLNNDFVNYYLVTDIDDHAEYFGIVFQRGFVPNYELINNLKNIHQASIIDVVSCGITRLSSNKSAVFAVVVKKYDPDANLMKHLQQGGSISKHMLQEDIIPGVTQAIALCEKYDTALGNICLENVLLNDDGSVVMREPFIHPSNFYQEPVYLTPELARCIPSARGSVVAEDIFALGVLIIAASAGELPTAHYDSHNDFLIAQRDHGSYKIITRGMRFTESWKMLMQGVLSDNAAVRWKTRHIFEWCVGNLQNVPKKPVTLKQSAYITFNGHNYITLESLVSAFCYDWDQALSFIGETKFHRWLSNLNLSDEIQQQIELLCATVSNDAIKSTYHSQTSFDERNRVLSRLLMLLGSGYVLHTKSASYSLHNFGQFIALNMQPDTRVSLQIVLNHLITDVDFLKAIFKIRCSDAVVQDLLPIIVANYKDDRNAISGIERLLYELCPDIPCQSSLIVHNSVYNIPTLLVELDSICHLNPDNLNLDHHIVAFIASKANVKPDADIKLLTKFPHITDDPMMLGLPILCIANREAPEIEIDHLVHAISTKLIELISDNIHNQKLQKNMIRQLLDEGERGDLNGMLAIISDTELFEKDHTGYQKALDKIKKLNTEINQVSQMNMIYSRGVFVGQKFTVLLSYILCLAVIVILMV